jgi:hypothetical protein
MNSKKIIRTLSHLHSFDNFKSQLRLHVAHEKKTERLRLNGSHAAQLCDMKVRSPRTKPPLLQLMISLTSRSGVTASPLLNPDG